MKDYIVFGYTNCRYKNLAVFWASYIKKLNVDYVIYCTDQESYKFLLSADVKCALSSFQNNSENFDFEDFSLVRFNILFDLLKSYKNVIYSDLDAIWISNPAIGFSNSAVGISNFAIRHCNFAIQISSFAV